MEKSLLIVLTRESRSRRESFFPLYHAERFKLEKLIARSVTKSDLWLDSARSVRMIWRANARVLVSLMLVWRIANTQTWGSGGAQEKFVLFAARVQDKEH